jgi:hypothetical protein
MQMYTIVRKFYHSQKDFPDNPYKVVDMWVENWCKPLTLIEAQTLLPKLMTDNLWMNLIVPIESKEQ